MADVSEHTASLIDPSSPAALSVDPNSDVFNYILRSANNPLQRDFRFNQQMLDEARLRSNATLLDAVAPGGASLKDLFGGTSMNVGADVGNVASSLPIGKLFSAAAGEVKIAMPAIGAARRAARPLADLAAETFRNALPRTMPVDHTEAVLQGIRDALGGDWDAQANLPREGSTWQPVPEAAQPQGPEWRPLSWSDMPLQRVPSAPAGYTDADIGRVRGTAPNTQHVVANGQRIADITSSPSGTHRVDVNGVAPAWFANPDDARNYAVMAHNHELPSQQPARRATASLSDADIEAHLARNPGASIFDVAGVANAAAPPAPSAPALVSAGALGDTTQKALDLFNTHFSPHFGDKEFADKFFAGMHDPEFISMEHAAPYEGRGAGLNFTGQLSVGGNPIGRIDRTIRPDIGLAEHSYLKLDPEVQGSGIGKELLGSQIDTYKKMGLNAVSLYANIDVGGYAWAKYGFVPSKFDWQSLTNRMGRYVDAAGIDPEVKSGIKSILESDDPKSIWKIADIKTLDPATGKPLGKSLLMNRGWSGQLDLNDAESMDRFNAYIKSKGK